MRGKNKCKILKEIRQKIADENDILYVTSECKYRGECSGTCPKCESELRYLERELEKRRALGKKVTFAGVAVTMALSLSSCIDLEANRTTSGVMVADSKDSAASTSDTESGNNGTNSKEAETLMGDIALPGEVPESTDEVLKDGSIPPEIPGETEWDEDTDIAGGMLPPESEDWSTPEFAGVPPLPEPVDSSAESKTN